MDRNSLASLYDKEEKAVEGLNKNKHSSKNKRETYEQVLLKDS